MEVDCTNLLYMIQNYQEDNGEPRKALKIGITYSGMSQRTKPYVTCCGPKGFKLLGTRECDWDDLEILEDMFHLRFRADNVNGGINSDTPSEWVWSSQKTIDAYFTETPETLGKYLWRHRKTLLYYRGAGDYTMEFSSLCPHFKKKVNRVREYILKSLGYSSLEFQARRQSFDAINMFNIPDRLSYAVKSTLREKVQAAYIDIYNQISDKVDTPMATADALINNLCAEYFKGGRPFPASFDTIVNKQLESLIGDENYIKEFIQKEKING